VKVLDDLAVPDQARYNITFRDDGGTLVYDVETESPTTETVVARDTFFIPLAKSNIIASSFTLTDASGGTVDPARYFLDAVGGRIRGTSPGSLPEGASFTARYRHNPVFASTSRANEDDNPVFDGMRLYVQDTPLGIDSLRSGWVVQQASNLIGVVQQPVAVPGAPFRPAPITLEVRWNRTDTTANGKWLFPGDTLLNNLNRRAVVCPFRIVNVTDDASLRILVANATSDSVWRPGREIVVVTPPEYAPQAPIPVMVGIQFWAPVGEDLVLPTEGDVFTVEATKPLTDKDRYTFVSTATRFEVESPEKILDNIYVVPNPYVVYSALESPGISSTLRGEKELQFRNLPPECTIRIYTLTGELVDTIVKNDSNSFARWGILSNEGQRLAYGIYLYHVEVPGVGEKIGRFALIK